MMDETRCGMCGGMVRVIRRRVKYDNACGERAYIFYRAECLECGIHTMWCRTREEAREKIRSRETMIKAANKWAINCPFYRHHDEKNIRCEGFAQGIDGVTIGFHSGDEKAAHMACFCKRMWEKCTIAKECEKKFGE